MKTFKTYREELNTSPRPVPRPTAAPKTSPRPQAPSENGQILRAIIGDMQRRGEIKKNSEGRFIRRWPGGAPRPKPRPGVMV